MTFPCIDNTRCFLPTRRMSGATAVEFAVLLPLLMVLCIGTLDFGRFAYAYIAIGNAGRVAAERGATNEYSQSTADLRRAAMEAAGREEIGTAHGMTSSDVSFAIDVLNDDRGLHCVTVTSRYTFVTIVSWPFIPQPLHLERTISFRRFR